MDKCMKKIHRKRDYKPKKCFKKALLIGINYMGTSSQLNGCINDVKKVQDYLLKNGFESDSIHTVTDHIGSTLKPTKENILKQIHWLVSDLPKNKQCELFFHYSGHGSYTYDRNKDERDGRDETLVPLDYETSGLILDDDLKVHLVDTLPENVDLFCILDCCHSGSGLDLRYRVRSYTKLDGLDEDIEENDDKYMQEFVLWQNKKNSQSKANVICLSGCKDSQYSADAYIKGKYQGAMTWGFINVVEKYNYAPISYKRLIREIQKLLKKSRYEQIPQLSTGKYVNLKQKFSL